MLCLSGRQKRVLLFAEWLDTHILDEVSHSLYVLTIPRLLNPFSNAARKTSGC
jgi:hypothetical protein